MSRATLVAAIAAAAVLASCGDWNSSLGGTVIDGHVTSVIEVGDRNASGQGMPYPFQKLKVQLDGGLYRGDVVDVEWGGRRALHPGGFLSTGDRVLLTESRDGSVRRYAIAEVVRLPALAPLAVALAVALVVVARMQGIASIAGLAGSVAVFLLAIVPALRRGEDPLAATLVGAVGVVAVSVFVVHGFNRKSAAALAGTLAGVGIVLAAGAVTIVLARMSGLGTEDEVFLAVGSDGRIDMQKLALAAVVVGSLGALVDMSVGQASATMELAAADVDLRGRRLYASALRVGRDHIGSLVNTLALAYFGGALPLVLLLSLGYQPLSVALNGEAIVASALTVLAASLGLVLCVPATTAIAVAMAD